ncbi:hypothetical protein A2U01_0044307, partial [Trifolium medium]|nr:hypothetical protein [Trifolium medium]
MAISMVVKIGIPLKIIGCDLDPGQKWVRRVKQCVTGRNGANLGKTDARQSAATTISRASSALSPLRPLQ